MPSNFSLLGFDSIADPDIILCLYPSGRIEGDNARTVLNLAKNKHYLVEPPQDYRSKTPSRSSTTTAATTAATTTTVGSEKTDGVVDIRSSRYFALRFSHGAKTNRGIVAGRSSNTDILLGGFDCDDRIGRLHIAFTFNKQNKLIVRDLGSDSGTSVVYGAEEVETRKNFEWILQGPDILEHNLPIITIAGLVTFTVIVPPHDITSSEYLDRVERFRKGKACPTELLAPLDLYNGTDTKLPSGKETPSGQYEPVFYTKKLGEGSFGVATYAWNVSTGEECVWKQPDGDLQLGRYNPMSWQSEAELLERISHDHIVAFQGVIYSSDNPTKLLFEYLPGGTLHGCTNMSRHENLQVLCQLLSALKYLHGQDPPIGHRDIKPENILVQYRRSEEIYVKFADFGLSKAAVELQTICGTPQWQAPEIHSLNVYSKLDNNEPYTVAVDIWSLGMVVAGNEYGLPPWMPQYNRHGLNWINAVLKYMKDRRHPEDELLDFLLNTMLVKDPQQRRSATECYEKALQLLNLHLLRHQKSEKCSESVTCSSEREKDDAGSLTPSRDSTINHSTVDRDHAQSDDDTEDILTPSQTGATDGSIESPLGSYHPDSSLEILESPNASLIAKLGERGSSFFNLFSSSSSFEWPKSSYVATSKIQPNLDGTPGVIKQASLPVGYQAANISDAAKATLDDQPPTQPDMSLMAIHKNKSRVGGMGKTTTSFHSTPYTSSGRLKRALPDVSIQAILERELQGIHQSESEVSGQTCHPTKELQSHKRPRVSNFARTSN